MGLHKFNLTTLADVDAGRLRVALEKQLRRVVEDCRDRAGLDKSRKVSLELVFTPYADDTGDCTHLNFEYEVKTSIPGMKREGLSLGVQKNGELLFSRDSPNNVDQATIFDDEQ